MQEKKSEKESLSLDILVRFVMFSGVNWIDSFLISYSLNKRIEEKSDILDKYSLSTKGLEMVQVGFSSS